MKVEDSFHFTINSKKHGYITLLNVYENGIVTLLQSSILIKNNIQIYINGGSIEKLCFGLCRYL